MNGSGINNMNSKRSGSMSSKRGGKMNSKIKGKRIGTPGRGLTRGLSFILTLIMVLTTVFSGIGGAIFGDRVGGVDTAYAKAIGKKNQQACDACKGDPAPTYVDNYNGGIGYTEKQGSGTYVHPKDSVTGNTLTGVWTGGNASTNNNTATPIDTDKDDFLSILPYGTIYIDPNKIAQKEEHWYVSGTTDFDAYWFLEGATIEVHKDHVDEFKLFSHRDLDALNITYKVLGTDGKGANKLTPIPTATYSTATGQKYPGGRSPLEQIAYVGPLTGGGAVDPVVADDGDPLIRVTYKDAAKLSDGTNADVVISYYKFNIKSTNLVVSNTNRRKTITVGNESFLSPLGLIDANQLYVNAGFYFNGNGAQAWGTSSANPIKFAVEASFDVSVQKNGVAQEGTIIWTTNDLDIANRYDSSDRTYNESLTITKGAESFAVTPFYDFDNPKNPLAMTLDGNGNVKFYASGARGDYYSYDSGFGMLISSEVSSMVWTGSRAARDQMGTVLFNTKAATYLEMTHGTGGGIYLESYDKDCNPYRIEGLAMSGLYAKPTVTVVPEDGYRVKDIYIDEVAGAGTTKYAFAYDDNGNVFINGTSVVDGKATVNDIEFEINDDGTVDVTLPGIDTAKHVHADFTADYYFYKVWKVPEGSTAQIPDKLELKATPFVFEMTSVNIGGTIYTISNQGTEYTANGTTYTMDSNLVLKIGDKQYTLHGNELWLSGGTENDRYPIEHTITSGTTQDFMVRASDTDYVTVIDNSTTTGEVIWRVKYPAAGRENDSANPWPALPIETEPSATTTQDSNGNTITIAAHGKTHVERNYWFVTEVSPEGWSMVDYDNDAALAPGVVTAKDSYKDSTQAAENRSLWHEQSVVYHDATEELIEAQEAKDHAFMSPLSSAVTGVDGKTTYTDWGGKISNYPAIIVKAEKEWKDDFTNDFNTRQDILFHLDAVVKNTTIKDYLPPIKVPADATGEALKVAWGDKKTYTTADDFTNVVFVDDYSKLSYKEDDGTTEISYVPQQGNRPGFVATSTGASNGKIYYVNELPVFDASGNEIKYSIRETSTVKKTDGSGDYEDIIGYTTKFNDKDGSSCAWDDLTDGTETTASGTEIKTKSGTAVNMLIREDFTINKKWLSPKTADQLKALEETMQKAVTISATPAEGTDVKVVNKDGADAYTGYKSDASKKDYYNWPTGDNAKVSTDGKTYTYTWKDLPSYLPVTVDGETKMSKVTYSAVESQLTGFAAPTYTNIGTDTASVSDKAFNSGTITNNQLFDIKVIKTWDDADNQDGKRSSIGVKLNRNSNPYEETAGDKAGEKTLAEPTTDGAGKNADELADLTSYYTDDETAKTTTWTWNKVWSGLPYADANGSEYTYTATEDTLDDYNNGVAVNVTKTVDAENGTITFSVTNKRDPDTVNISATKIWNDGSNQDGKRQNIKLRLLANGEVVEGKADIEVSKDAATETARTATWSDLPRYKKAGQAITYTIVELDANGTTQLANGGKTSYGYDVAIASQTDTSGNVTATVTNSYTPLTAKLTVNKVWDDEKNRDGKRAESFVVYIDKQKDGDSDWTEGIANKTVSIGEDSFTVNEWELPAYEGGKKLTYRVREYGTVTGYTTTYKLDSGADGTTQPTTTLLDADGKAQGHTVTVTNKNEPEKISVTVTKKWDDDTNRDGIRPTAEAFKNNLTLKGDDTQVKTGADATVTTNADGTYTYTWTDLYKNKAKTAASDATTAITYTIEESAVDNYTPVGATTTYPVTVAAGGTLENKYTPETTSVTITKTWSDNNDQDGLRPTADEYKSSLTLKAGSTDVTSDHVGKLTVTDNNNGTYTVKWTGLPKNQARTDAQAGTVATAIAYTVEEKTIDGYTASAITGSQTDGFAVTNSHTPATGKVVIKKIWDDASDQDGKRPTEIKVTLKSDNTPALSQEVILTGNSTTNEWTSDAIENLPVYKTGKVGEKVTYSIEETAAQLAAINTGLTDSEPKYTIKGYDPENITLTAGETSTLTVTNERTLGTSSVKVIKQWDDKNNQDGLRVGTIAFTLKGSDGSSNTQSVAIDKTKSDNENAGEYTWTNLPVYKDGKKITYTVTEDTTITGYDAPEYAGTDADKKNAGFVLSNDTYEVTVTNKHTPDQVNPPTGTDEDTYGGKGEQQTSTADFKFTKGSGEIPSTGAYSLEDPDSDNPLKKTIPGEGVYELDPDTGVVTFTPEADFVGDGTGVTVKVTDENGLSDTGKYTPHVVDNTKTVKRTITYEYSDGTPVTDDNGDPLTVVQTVTFTGTVDPKTGAVTYSDDDTETFDEVTSPSIDDWTPDKEKVDAKTVKPSDSDSTEKVIYNPEGLTPTPDETYGLPGENQTGTPTFTPDTDTLPDGTTNTADNIKLIDPTTGDPTDIVTISGQGTYTMNSDGTITFTPVDGFVGNPQPVGVIGTDKLGNTARTTYTPHVVDPTDTGTATRTIHYTYRTVDGAPVTDDVVQTVTLIRHATKVDPKTGEVLEWGDWESATFPALPNPDDEAGSGWTTTDSVEARTVNEPGDFGEVNVVYTQKTDPDPKPDPQPDPDPTPTRTYWVTYVDPDGTTIYLERTTRTVGAAEPPAPANPTKDGYTFDGWDRSVDANGNITYTARWTPVGPTDPTDPTDPVDPTPTDPTDPTNPTDPVDPTPTDPENPNPPAEERPWVRYIDVDGTEIYMDKTAFDANGVEPPAPANPTKDGYLFDGWDRSVDSFGNVTYTARWKPNAQVNPGTVKPNIEKPATNVAKTGDQSNARMWIGILVIAVLLAAIAALVRIRTKK